MSRTLSSVALAAVALLPLQATHAQNRSSTKLDSMTIVLRRPAWFGFALDCADCGTARPGAAATRRFPVIARVLADGPAARASLAAGDTIVAVDGKEMTTAELRLKLEGMRGGDGLRLGVGTRGGRKTVSLRATSGNIEVLGRDSLPVRYRGEYAEVSVDVFTMAAPVVSRDSTGAMIIKVGDHVLRLHRGP
jgi:membrane-associated protease RseP (regulator of RpoE activity)